MSNNVVKGNVHINSLVCILQLTSLAMALLYHVCSVCLFPLLDYDTQYQITIFPFFIVVDSCAFEMVKAHIINAFLYFYATYLLLLQIICEVTERNTRDRGKNINTCVR